MSKIDRINKVKEIAAKYEDFGLYVEYAEDYLYAVSEKESEATDKKVTCIELSFHYDNNNCIHDIDIDALESHHKGNGTKLVDILMEWISSDVKVYVTDVTDGEDKKFWPKLDEKYPNLIVDYIDNYIQ